MASLKIGQIAHRYDTLLDHLRADRAQSKLSHFLFLGVILIAVGAEVIGKHTFAATIHSFSIIRLCVCEFGVNYFIGPIKTFFFA